MVALVKETKGEVFIKAIEEAKNNKGHIFSLLLETLQNEYPQAEAVTIVNKVKNFDALVNYDASLAKFQIGRNGDNIRKRWKTSARRKFSAKTTSNTNS